MEEEIESILRTVGLESCPVDPSSMEALAQLVRERQHGTGNAAGCSAPPGAAAAAAAPTMPSTQHQNSEQSEILQLLRVQTSMIMETQRKLDAVAEKVERLEQQLGVQPVRSTATTTTTRQERNVDQTVPERNAAPAVFQPVQSIVDAVSTLTLVRIVRLFLKRSQGFVRPLDGGLMFKLVFMIVVMTARMSRSPASASAHRFYVSMMFVVIGFLYHTKYLQFCYLFFWKENIPMRVWAGEDVENEANRDGTEPRPVDRPPPQGRNNDHDNEARNADHQEDRQQNFLAGAIHPRDLQQNLFFSLLQDIFYLFGSFFFSIFPMWQPVAPPPPQQAQPRIGDQDGRERPGQPQLDDEDG